MVVPNGVTEIPEGACRDRTDIREVVLHGRVESIGREAFRYCTGIAVLQLPDALLSVGDSRGRRPSLSRPHGHDHLAAARRAPACPRVPVGRFAFCGCTGLATLELPCALEHVGDFAFEGCARLARVLAPDTLVQGETADPSKGFAGCPALAAGLTPFSMSRDASSADP